MISYLDFRNGLKKIVKPAAAALLAISALALSNSTGGLLQPVTKPHYNGPPLAELPWLPQHLHHKHHRPPTAPEANAGLVMIPIVVAVMLLSSRHILRKSSEAK